MIRKTWHKQLHRRKIWKSYGLFEKIWYFMKPFLVHLLMVWLQPLPVPTILKIFYSCCLVVVILFPLIYPGTILLASYWVLQYIGERDLNLTFSPKLDLHRFIQKLSNVDPTGEYNQAVYYYFQRLKIMAAAAVTVVDYIRLATSAIFGV